jgi:hypothetical protein
MRIVHSAITSSIYEVCKVVEFDLQLGDESWPIRIEVLRNTEIQGRFRCRIWQAELFRIQSTFPMGKSGLPQHHPSDELIWVEFSGPKVNDYYDFPAKDVDAALSTVLKDFETFLEHTTLEKSGSQ